MFGFQLRKNEKPIVSIVIVLFSFSLGFCTNEFLPLRQPKFTTMKKVIGIGGIFFKCKDPEKVKEWYSKHLGFNMNEYGTSFEWRQGDDPTKFGSTQWSTFSDSTNYFDPSVKEFMINYRVDDLENLVNELRNEGVTILDSIESYDYGKFVHILDNEGNKIELWESVD